MKNTDTGYFIFWAKWIVNSIIWNMIFKKNRRWIVLPWVDPVDRLQPFLFNFSYSDRVEMNRFDGAFNCDSADTFFLDFWHRKSRNQMKRPEGAL